MIFAVHVHTFTKLAINASILLQLVIGSFLPIIISYACTLGFRCENKLHIKITTSNT